MAVFYSNAGNIFHFAACFIENAKKVAWRAKKNFGTKIFSVTGVLIINAGKGSIVLAPFICINAGQIHFHYLIIYNSFFWRR